MGLEGSSAPDVRSIVLECGSNTYDALCNGVGAGVPCLTRGQKQSQEKAVMKDKPFVPTTEF